MHGTIHLLNIIVFVAGSVHFIDHEYAMYNYEHFEIGNHFCEYAGTNMRKLDFCLYENKDTDQLCSYCTVDLCLCFRFRDITILLLESKISSF